MSPLPTSRNVIVTRAEVERLFSEKSAESAIHEAAKEQNSVDHAKAMAMTGAILRELARSEEEHGSPGVLVTAQHGPASRLQSLIASGAIGELQLSPLPAGGLEAQFDTSDWLGWATVAWAKLKNPIPHPLKEPSHAGPQSLPESGRVGIVGDWGTGLYGAPRIAQTIKNDPDPFMMLMHLGDVYYAGAEDEMRDRFLRVWPKRNDAVHRALNSNHDMYSGGKYYFEDVLPDFNQDASYFAHQNKHWTLVGLDVAHTDHSIDDRQVEWLKGILAQAGDRKVILFSHHQLFSCFESQGSKLWLNQGFADILSSKRIFAWYWGHEHRCAIYQERHAASGLWGRCIGHGGMPQSRKKTKHLPQAPNQPNADWRIAPANVNQGAVLAPQSLVLEGRNQDIIGEEDDFTPHGYAVLAFDGPHLTEQVLDVQGNVIYERPF
jgi:hypothetical protein